MTKPESRNTMTDSNDAETDLSEEDIRRIAQEETSVSSADGTTVSLFELKDRGLAHDDAILALGLIAGGAGIGTAIAAASSSTVTAQSSTGSGTIEIGELIANQIVTAEADAAELTGSVVGRSSSITHLGGNWHVSETEPSSPSDDDVLFKLGGN